MFSLLLAQLLQIISVQQLRDNEDFKFTQAGDVVKPVKSPWQKLKLETLSAYKIPIDSFVYGRDWPKKQILLGSGYHHMDSSWNSDHKVISELFISQNDQHAAQAVKYYVTLSFFRANNMQIKFNIP